jgi:hypothetical protein
MREGLLARPGRIVLDPQRFEAGRCELRVDIIIKEVGLPTPLALGGAGNEGEISHDMEVRLFAQFALQQRRFSRARRSYQAYIAAPMSDDCPS